MRFRQIFLAIVIVGTVWHAALAQPKKSKVQVDAPPLEKILAGASMQFDPVLTELIAVKPEMPLGPKDVLKSYEVAMNILADRTSADFSVIVQAQQTNQITREQAEYLLQQRYEIAMMQYQVLSALHDVLKHDIDDETQQSKHSAKVASSNEVVVVPFPGSPSGAK